ncbi:MAG: succinate dehydrogenase cytochrome b subunit [Deltaproteobacteria bacterium]|nr:succinate dehydrogenase cytochrome b subunit [Deltaproteobacteria bacterium]
MAAIWYFLRSTIGLKVVMAVSGFFLFGFLVEHMIGNLLFFLGPDLLNGYAELLHASQLFLWTARSVMILAAGFHATTALVLYLRQRAARPVGYRRTRSRTFSYAARTMKYTGPLVLVFVLFHLAHFTLGWQVTPAPFVEGDVYANVVASFQHTWVAVVYVVAVLLVGFHFIHGGHSLFESLGVRHPRFDGLIRTVTGGFAVAVTVGFVALPCAILFKLAGG